MIWGMACLRILTGRKRKGKVMAARLEDRIWGLEISFPIHPFYKPVCSRHIGRTQRREEIGRAVLQLSKPQMEQARGCGSLRSLLGIREA